MLHATGRPTDQTDEEPGRSSKLAPTAGALQTETIISFVLLIFNQSMNHKIFSPQREQSARRRVHRRHSSATNSVVSSRQLCDTSTIAKKKRASETSRRRKSIKKVSATLKKEQVRKNKSLCNTRCCGVHRCVRKRILVWLQ